MVRGPELEDFLDLVRADCLVVLDEAYHEYIRDEAVPDGVTVYRDRPNVAVLRTFSKVYGLAGLRTGFMIAHEPVAAAIRATMLPFTVNRLAQAAAIASLAAEAELLERVEFMVKERTRVHEALLADGWTVPPTEANFVWLRLGDSREVRAKILRASSSTTSTSPVQDLIGTMEPLEQLLLLHRQVGDDAMEKQRSRPGAD